MNEPTIRWQAPSAEHMRQAGARIAKLVHGGDVILLSGPLGAGKTTFAQGFGRALHIDEPIVSPTFTIARELNGQFPDGTPATLIHVDAYRLGGNDYAPGQNSVDRLLDELESIGLDEELESPGAHSVILMEWGEQMAAALAPQRLEIHIDRPLAEPDTNHEANSKPIPSEDAYGELTSEGERTITITPVGDQWVARLQDHLA
ncbi:tRNA (adenosine(37)-N6)-threonylcarbamoyltransferase complex ATPase subunit type 1 TsaE [Bifidobacterium gallicum]|nr:tRNA (adenosine(37)-N6)-threonylcarbamoyltransferase complex ATPase subunit type 1 TsaE [Bifidobacterium gallicum]KFI58817.1 ATPase [Bifidobacterium gallicum DSM 20093 = LMG 11596]